MKLLKLLPIALLTLVACNSPVKESNPVLTIEGGQIQGVLNDSSQVILYKGIPYAAAPVGDLRWKKPQPVTPWEGIKIADTWGNAAIQASLLNMDLYTKEFYSDGDPVRSEDCLYLNVWTPADAAGNTERKLPVAMWIHGGAYDHGYGYEKTMDGEAWAQRGVILVTINYRVGILGFISHPLLSAEDPDGVSGNYGTCDQIAALKWIKNNITQFGGDPNNITIFGQSAGGGSIKNLSMSPLSKGLISKAIIQSAGGISEQVAPAVDPKVMDEQFKKVFDAAGLTTLEQMRAATPDELTKAFDDYNANCEPSERVRTRPFADGVVTLEDFTLATKDNSIANIPYMIGCVAGDGPTSRPGIELFSTIRNSLSDKPVYSYFFNRPLPGDDRGSFHSSELWYMFHTLDRCWRPFTEADYELADRMTDYWTNFCKYGNPNGNNGDQEWKAGTSDSANVFELNIK